MSSPSLAWGAKVSPTFRDMVRRIAQSLQMPQDGASWLMACMAWESGRTFSPSVVNAAGSGAVGLIQFMPATARSMGTTTDALKQMTAEQQLSYVLRYFDPYRGKLQLLSDCYMAILWPAAVGKSDSTILWDKDTRPTTYRENAGLDGDHNGQITKAEATARVHDCYVEGLRPINVGV
jgi:hypothetical protein